MAKDLTKIFNRFAGKEVRVEERAMNFGSELGEQVIIMPDQNDPTYIAMEKIAKDSGRGFFLFPATWENHPATKKNNFVGGFIEKGTDNKWHVKNKFEIN